jgi:hypothetical protein
MVANIGTISGLAVAGYPTDQVNEWPVAMVGIPERVEYDQTFHGATGGWVLWHIPVRLYVGHYDVQESVIALEKYISPTGSLSFKSALEAAGATSNWHYINVSEAREFGNYPVAGQELLGCEFVVEVMTE